jgi:NADH-quinone oxidoreductase subunit B
MEKRSITMALEPNQPIMPENQRKSGLVIPDEAKNVWSDIKDQRKSGISGVVTLKSEELFAMARKSSLWPLTFGLACCAIEMISTYMPKHDFDRFGVVTWPSPRQSDVMIVAGTVVKKMAEPIKLLYEQMAAPKWVIAMGSCATCGGPYVRSYSVVMGVDQIIPVDVYVPGCPPRPEALLGGVMELQDLIQNEPKKKRGL